ncbi:MAG: glycoside hydrolase family 9 protein [Streptosporangiaceae bacterium]|nr:glycoside hydrolase family 9 protein [Streptosporangiaceae bacterium]
MSATGSRPLPRRAFLGASAGTVAVGAVTALGGQARAAQPAALPGLGTLQVFVNNVGYEADGPKRLVVGAAHGSGPLAYQLVDTTSGAVVHRGVARFAGPVADWRRASPQVPAVYWTGDFSGLARQSQYIVVAGDADGSDVGWSYPFQIEAHLYERHTMSHVLHYFKGSRSSGPFEKRDRRLPVGQNGTHFVDVHGGWYDATGDLGIHFAQYFQGPTAPYLVTTQAPLTAWVLFASLRQIERRWSDQYTQLRYWLLDEAMYGADWLVRMQPADGSFYWSIDQPEPGNTMADPEDPRWRFLDTVPHSDRPLMVSFRTGGGSAIGALAIASTRRNAETGEYGPRDYLSAAERAFRFLQANNRKLNYGTPDNILDDSEVLIAASELYRATGDQSYLAIARDRAHSLASRVTSKGYWRAGDGSRPFFHPSNAGLPAVSLLSYADLAGGAERARLLEAARRSLQFEIAATQDTVNPFGYARQLVQVADGRRFTTFFYPHDVSPSTQAGGWFQGENARLGSLAAAARLLAVHGGASAPLEQYATDQLNWICGLNPYASCMLNGVGVNNPQYYDVAGTWQFLPQAGGINNGISGLTTDGRGIQYEPGYRSDAFTANWPDDWRIMEQWLPHSTWFLFATAIGPTSA